MPELPDILLYQHGLHHRLVGARINEVRIKSPFVLRTFDPPIDALPGQRIAAVGRIGKRLVISTSDSVHVVIHLMIAGRLLWKPERQVAASGKIDLASFLTDRGTLVLTEAAKLKRASLHVLSGDMELSAHAQRGLDVLTCEPDQFARVLTSERRTLKRALTSPANFDGIGNAYSDEILWKARLSPLAHTTLLSVAEVHDLHEACRVVLSDWTNRLLKEFEMSDVVLEPGQLGDCSRTVSGRFPGVGQVTAFRPGFAVHGRFQRPCPTCGTPVQRIVRAENEVNYCPMCQTSGKVLADRSLSRLLKDDWPDTVDAWEAHFGG